MPKKFYVTTSIPYVNAAPHIGFALELAQTDAIARWQRQHKRDVFFLTGADENSLKNVRAAEAEKMSTPELVIRNTQRFSDLGKALNISNSAFIRTSLPEHHAGAQALWRACKSEDIYRKSYQGLYCVGCETFYLEKDLVGGTCPEHRTVPELVNEENYFFRLSAYQQRLLQLINDGTLEIIPEGRRNEITSFISMGLEDFSISRSRTRAKDWGVDVPGDPGQVMYVWFDALSNYLTALGYGQKPAPRYKRYWPADLHVIGKGITRFHAVYWPAMLLSAGVPLPRRIFVHGYITVGGGKISKSLGNTVDPFALIDEFGADPVRYYLLRYVHPTQDSDFSAEKVAEAYQADLANGLGNLTSRVTGLIEQSKMEITPRKLPSPSKELAAAMASFDFNEALRLVWEEVRRTDALIAAAEPWKLAKAGKTTQLKTVLAKALTGLATAAFWLEPFLPATAEKIQNSLAVRPMVKVAPLFPRLEIKEPAAPAQV
ncbi:MAG: methionyl-tRNA synthetase [Parcubacteria group bacterium Gr01-1014_31]|nr:MAG: methionyl-tRNA synthetase [Parcubacteria group bacterium Gr01-1014_31]